jgi:hypothetical protein
MSYLAKLQLVALQRRDTLPPLEHRRARLIARLSEQLALAEAQAQGKRLIASRHGPAMTMAIDSVFTSIAWCGRGGGARARDSCLLCAMGRDRWNSLLASVQSPLHMRPCCLVP